MTSEIVKLQDVSISVGRWNVAIQGTDETGARQEYIASADSALTSGDGVWFGTRAEWDEMMRG